MKLRQVSTLKFKTKFPHLLWHYTGAKENLFELSKSELYIYKCLVREANK